VRSLGRIKAHREGGSTGLEHGRLHALAFVSQAGSIFLAKRGGEAVKGSEAVDLDKLAFRIGVGEIKLGALCVNAHVVYSINGTRCLNGSANRLGRGYSTKTDPLAIRPEFNRKRRTVKPRRGVFILAIISDHN